jgi:hypothetical protein
MEPSIRAYLDKFSNSHGMQMLQHTAPLSQHYTMDVSELLTGFVKGCHHFD